MLRVRRGSRWGWNIPQESWLGPRLRGLAVRARPVPTRRKARVRFHAPVVFILKLLHLLNEGPAFSFSLAPRRAALALALAPGASG